MRRSAWFALAFGSLACGASGGPPPNETAASVPSSSASSSSPAVKAPGVPDPPTATLDQIWSKVKGDVTACYETGRRAIPTMTTGRITLHAAIGASGKTTCVVPSDDTGLTQDVEDCMRERLGREAYPASRTEWSTALPIAVQNGALALGTIPNAPSIETVESRGLAEDMYDVLDGLLPDAKTCLRSIAKSSALRVVYVGARVGATGAVDCALASSTSPIPTEARQCVAKVFARAKFAPPKHGIGLLSVPIELVSKGAS